MVNATQGPAKALGEDVSRGIKAYFEMTNKQGGIHGRQLNLIHRNDSYEPTNTIRETKDLIGNQDVFSLIGFVGTPTSKAAISITRRDKVPFLSHWCLGTKKQQKFPCAIIRGSYNEETEALVSYLVDKKGLRKLGFSFRMTATARLAKKALKQHGKKSLKIVGEGIQTKYDMLKTIKISNLRPGSCD